MAHRNVHLAFITFLAVTSAIKNQQTRWSRQISSYTSDISDWVPLPGPVEKDVEPLPQIKRQAIAEPRILSEPFPGLPRPTNFGPDAFPSRSFYNTPANRQLYLQSVPAVPSAPQNYLSDQGFRFGLSQPNFPLTQGFVAPPFGFDGLMPKTRPPVVNPVSFPQSQGAPVKSFINQAPKLMEKPKFVDGYRVENVSSDYTFKRPQSLQKMKFENVEKPVKAESGPNPKSEREEVQLLYVPLDSLNRGQFNFRSPITQPQLLNSDIFSQNLPRPGSLKPTFLNDYQRQTMKPVENFGGNYFSDNKEFDQVPKFSTLTTPFPTAPPTTPKLHKLKPHQPPLAIFMTKEASKSSQVKVGDVLTNLKHADTIAVLDAVNPANAPKVFIGPSTLSPPDNYVKFELPYLSNIENSEKKIKQLPFFVAPLSYHTPQGFAKIPFPSPHVGSVVINAQIRDNSQSQVHSQFNGSPNYLQTSPPYKTEQKPITQKPMFTYFSTASPETNNPKNNNNYYSFEPQTVSSIKPKQQDTLTTPAKPTSGSYFLSNPGQYNSKEYVNFPQQNHYKSSELYDQYDFRRQPDTTTSLKTTPPAPSTTTKPSTYPSQLLETHNPYSINQAFHFSTPLDYHNYFDDVKQPYVSPDSAGHSTPSSPSNSVPSSPPSPSPTPSYSSVDHTKELETEKSKYTSRQPPQTYLQNYTPEIHYNSNENLKYPVFNHDDYVSKEKVTQQTHSSESSSPITDNNNNSDYVSNINSANAYQTNPTDGSNTYYNTDVTNQNTYKTEYNQDIETQAPVEENSNINLPAVHSSEASKYDDEYNQYVSTYSTEEVSPSSSTTTTTTRRTPQRGRGRPRYTTTQRPDYESTSRSVVTRRPITRKPLPTRPRYEPNKITTERSNRYQSDSNESSTKSSRSRTRGRIHYRPSEEDVYDRKTKNNKGKDADLAYQRDVLQQNYPQTIQERMSTVDIEAITEATKKDAFKEQDPNPENMDTENAYTYERASISQPARTESKEELLPTYTARSTQTESPYVSRVASTRSDVYYYQSKSSTALIEPSSYDQSFDEKEEDIYAKHTTPLSKQEDTETNSYATESSVRPVTEQNVIQAINNELGTLTQEDTTEASEFDNTKENQEEDEQNVVQTTPSYNRVRVRPGVIRQYHQSSTESNTRERKRPAQAVTYRPAYSGRRTTMRIDEIEADLKTKPVNSKPDLDYRHPVYKPDPTTEATVTSSTTESTTKRGNFRRRRPTYSTTSTESSTTKRTYETKNRFRGRRPVDRTTEKPEVQSDSPVATTKTPHSRYIHRPRLSDRYNKKTTTEEPNEDQDSNFSINRPAYATLEKEQWSPKISSDSFKPYNPNDIIDDEKIATTERRSDKESELDIITARNEFDEDILLTVTPASNNRMNKKIPDIPPTLEALVEQSKVKKSESGDAMSTFETILEEVMKSLEEQDKDEYSGNVMKHKGGEIGEIPPERIISSGDNQKSTTAVEETTTQQTVGNEATLNDEEEKDRKPQRRGFWKKVKVRPVTTESIDYAESQYYANTVNELGESLKPSKAAHEKTDDGDKPKVTTYKPAFQFINNIFSNDNDEVDEIPTVDIFKLKQKYNQEAEKDEKDETLIQDESKTTVYIEKETQPTHSPGDLDLGTGSPDPTADDYISESAPTKSTKSDSFSFMDYLFGTTSEDKETQTNKNETEISSTEVPKTKIVTTETAFIPEEITTESDDNANIPEFGDIKRVGSSDNDEHSTDATEISVVKVESSSASSFMDPANFISTSMSTEVSHETEICFRGKCIKTNRDIL